MANFMTVKKVLNPQNLIKPSVTLECRRYLPKGRNWSVTCRSGWGLDRPLSVDRNVSKEQARKIASDFIAEYKEAI